MLTPEELQRMGETMLPVIDDLRSWIMRDMTTRLMARLGNGEALLLTGTDEWQTRVYQEAGGLLDDLQNYLARFLHLTQAEVANIFGYAGIKSLAADSLLLLKFGKESISLTRHMAQLLESEYKRTMGNIINFTQTTAIPTQTAFVELLNAAHAKVITGAQSYTAAVREAVDALSGTQTRVYYGTGHTDTIETAVLRAIRTGTAQATGAMTLRGLEERDYDLIRVSAHLGARTGDGGQNPGNHAWWQGKLFSRTGKTPGYLPFSATGYGTGEGLCGWNCRHSFGPGDPDYNPYKEFSAEENQKAYELSQKQRAMERAIRKSKEKLLTVQAAIDASGDPQLTAELKEDYTKAAAKLQQQNGQYNAFCQQTDLMRYDDRLRIAHWDRSAAAKAAAAARRASH